MLTNYPVNSRIRAHGKARIDLALRLNNSADWDEQWKPPSNPFPFTWGDSWKQCVEYRVDDFAAEVGFFIDVLGFHINALDRSYAMFTSPQYDFFFAIVPTSDDETPTSLDAFRLQFMVRDVNATYQELLHRGIAFELTPQPLCQNSSITITSFRTPNGISIEIWGISTENSISPQDMRLGKNLERLVSSNHKDEPPDEEDNREFDDKYNDDQIDEEGFDGNDEAEIDFDKGEDEGEDEGEDKGEEDKGEDDKEWDEDEDTDGTDEAEEEDNYDDDMGEEEDDEDEYGDDYELEEDEEDDDEDDFDEDDYEPDEDDDDNDEDDYGSGKYSSIVKVHPKINRIDSSTQPHIIHSGSSEMLPATQPPQLLEYIDVETF
jgi:catechol 2,3-dioxygenase-like lactoylglutathione lyase family enzyme